MSRPVAIITGAGKGIGRATAMELAGRGYDLVLVARTQADLDETISLAGGGVAVAGDICDLATVDRAVATATSTFGQIDALVNNAGYAPLLPIEKTTPQEWQRVIDTNLTATYAFCRAVWPVYRERNGGAIVNLSSAASRDPFGGFSAYGAAKAGVNLLGLALAREGGPLGIRVYTVAPGAVETSMFRGLMTPEQYSRDKTLDPSDVARVIGSCIAGELQHSSGEVIHVHRRVS